MLNLLNVITAGTSIFLAFLVFTVRRDTNTLANRWLAAFLLLVGLFILDDSLVVYGIYQRHPWVYGYFSLPNFALAPALYLTVSQFVSVERRFRKKDLWHFSLFFLFTLLSLPFLFAPKAVKLAEIAKISEPLGLADYIFLSVLVIQILSYLFFSFRKLKRHQKNMERITASPTEFNLNWLLYFLYGVMGLTFIWFCELFFQPLQTDASGYTLGYLVAIYCLGYFALRQKEVFPFSQKEAEAVGEMLDDTKALPSERRLIFDEEKRNELKTKLLQKMETERPYLDAELNLPKLAKLMDLSVHEMSELVNEGFGENFAQFVNRYRVEESKQLLFSEKHAHLNMVGIAFEAGFNSKTAFNTAFKKQVGMTPSEFQKL